MPSDTWPVADDGTFRQKPSELTLAERADGSVLISGREQDGTDLGHRSQTVSRDGGTTFAAPFRALPDLYTPQVQGSLLRLGDRMLLAGPYRTQDDDVLTRHSIPSGVHAAQTTHRQNLPSP